MKAEGSANGLQRLEAGDIVALTSPDFVDAPADLGLFDPETLRSLLHSAGTAGGRAGTHALTTSAGVDLVVRPFRRGGWLAALGRSPRLRSPERWFDEMNVTHALRCAGAPVPAPAFAIACRSGSRWDGAVSTVRVDAAVDAATFARDASRSAKELEQASAACGRATRAFHECGGRHRDLHAGNLLVSAAGDEAWVIDLDRGRVGAPPSPRRRARELARLVRSLEKLGLRERLGDRCLERFAGAYTEGAPELAESIAAAWRSERWAIALHRLTY